MQLDENQIKKYRTKGTAKMILELTVDLELSSMLSDIFMYTEDLVAKELIKRYESQLVLAVVEPKKFEQGLHVFYKETTKYIKKNKLFKEFYSFCYFIYSTFSTKVEEKQNDKTFMNTLNCYYNILFQQMNYFVSHPKLAYGLDTKGRLMLRTEPFPYLDIAIIKAHRTKGGFSKEEAFKNLRKYGYKIDSEHMFRTYHSNDQLITNMLLIMSYFINENTININPKEFYMLANGIQIPRIKTKTEIYKKLLQKKRYFLPIKGVTGHYKNCGDIREVFYQEVFTENRIILLYKVTSTEGKEFSGFYDNKLEFFYSPWDDTNFGMLFHKDMENFILESYAYLTTDIDEKMNEIELDKRLYLENEVPVISVEPLPSVQFLYNEKETSGKDNKKGEENIRLFDKRKYQDSKVSINPFIRRLPLGSKASEEAIALAKEYNYVLREGETFVRPFERTTYRKKE